MTLKRFDSKTLPLDHPMGPEISIRSRPYKIRPDGTVSGVPDDLSRGELDVIRSMGFRKIDVVEVAARQAMSDVKAEGKKEA